MGRGGRTGRNNRVPQSLPNFPGKRKRYRCRRHDRTGRLKWLLTASNVSWQVLSLFIGSLRFSTGGAYAGEQGGNTLLY